jgi:hypothetical protein
MVRLPDTMVEHAPALGGQSIPLDAVQLLEYGVRRETGAQDGGDALPCPLHDFGERIGERLGGEIGAGDVGPGDDERVEAILSQRLERALLLGDVFKRLGAPREAG